ncbi:hypothetical protein MLD38_037578 [Melastoma candidum]|uniref:Uncharacterized protein n=1 Tax=Melastoma candidum TaxID=119954 RepID=A0ACB9LNI1_9MYRT|nr:hypothetical protein MLD38_037578 [Melastoma candidum]
MILVSTVAEIMEEYTAVLARLVEVIFDVAPVPRRVRLLILRNLPFSETSSDYYRSLALPPVRTTTAATA